MTTAIKSAISPFAQPKSEPNGNAIRFLDEKRASVPASDIPEDFCKVSRFLPVIVLVPKSAVEDEATQKKLEPNKSVSDLTNTRNVCLPLDAAKAWLTIPTPQTRLSLAESKDVCRRWKFIATVGRLLSQVENLKLLRI
jgi:hypothetical protein